MLPIASKTTGVSSWKTDHKAVWRRHNLDFDFVQENHSRSKNNVVRGLHFQDNTAPQTRVIRCTQGEVLDVVVDLRVGSPTFGRWLGVVLSMANRHQLVIPPEFAHGFAVLSEVAEIQYRVTGHHTPNAERTLTWNDEGVGIVWPTSNPVLSERDKLQGQSLAEYLRNPCFHYCAATMPAAALAEVDDRAGKSQSFGIEVGCIEMAKKQERVTR